MRRRLLDLFCCEGGCSVGYSRAGWDVYGLDLFVDYTQARYPFPSCRMDALDALAILLAGGALPFVGPGGVVEWLGLADFDAISASPPCQRYSITNAARQADYPDLVEPVRQLLIQTGLPYVIENVEGAPLLDALLLCGSMFGLTARDEDGVLLRLERHRLFESNVPLYAPGPCQHDPEVWPAGVYGGNRLARRPLIGATPAPWQDRHEARYVRKGGYVPRSARVQEALLGVDWMTRKGRNQSIPPAYTAHLGTILASALDLAA